ncbi:AAA family ATPase [Aliarcobacter butzleri]|uniref:AAA family ATPase n=1 Tax=Aliarcobacter butzleri TaxID=28197 RepID=UPI003AF4A81F
MIKLDRLYISNFKSLKDFTLDFSKFTCLIGLNSSGKSTILQAIDFISQQMNGNISQWLKDRNWETNELTYKLEKRRLIVGGISFSYNEKYFFWYFRFNPLLKKCTNEELNLIDINIDEKRKVIFKVEDSKYTIIKDLDKNEKLEGDIIQDYEGSFLANLKSELLPDSLIEFREYLRNIYSLDLLAPQELRMPSRKGSKLGLSGKNISAYLDTFNEEQKNALLEQLKKCYKNFDSFDIKKSKGGWARLEVVEKFENNGKLVNEGRYLNDGTLRLIAILSQLQSKQSFLLFDEIENGINSELIEFLLDTLIASNHQVMITTHSPMILNYIDDETAIKSVNYIYKTEEGFTKSIPFFSIPSMKDKLELMGAGEVYVDTNLSNLLEEIKLIEAQKENKEDK